MKLLRFDIKNIIKILIFFITVLQPMLLKADTYIDSSKNSRSAEFYNEDGKLFLPLDEYKVSSIYGYRYHPQTNVRHFHPAIDLDVNWGDPVYAAEKGKVAFSGWKSGLGYYIKIKHGVDRQGNNIATAYAHLSRLLVDKGEVVLAGQKIGKAGSTGKSTGSHLHFEVHQNNIKKNPAVFFRHHEMKEFTKYTVGGGRREIEVKQVSLIFPEPIPIDIKLDLPEWAKNYYKIPDFMYPEIILAGISNIDYPEKMPAPVPINKSALKIRTENKNPRIEAKPKTIINKPVASEILYGVQVCASRIKLKDEQENSLKKQYGKHIKEDYDGEYYRYTLLALDNKYFKNENEVRNYVRKLNNEEFMGVICYKNGKRITMGWE